MENGPATPGATCLVVFNTSSGKGEDKPGAEQIEAAFARHGVTVSILNISGEDDVPARVAEAVEQGGLRCVVAAGGDGTICAVAGAIEGKEVELGVLPLGTFNYFARRLGLPTELDAAVEAICRGRTTALNLGSVNREIFINNASIGLYPAILRERESIYKRWGRSRLAAYWSVIVAMVTLYRPLTLRITVDGEVRSARSPMVFVGLSAYQLDEFDIEGADAIRNGKFALLLAPDVGRFRLIWTALRIAMRGVQEGRDFTLLTGARMTVETRRSHRLVAMDGERKRMKGPFEFRILKNAIHVRLPGGEEAPAEVPETRKSA